MVAKRLSILTLTLIFSFSFLIPSVLAQNGGDGISLGYAPTTEYLELDPGENYKGELTVWNLKSDTTKYFIYVKGFRQVEDYPGTAIPLTDEQEDNAPYSAADWFTMELEELDLVPQKNITIGYTIDVPVDIAFGEYHAKIFLSSEPPDEILTEDDAAAFTALGSGPNILIQVGEESDIIEEADLIKFDSDRHFYEKPDVKLYTEFENTGNTHVTPKGDISIVNIFGTEVARMSFNPGDISTLRGETARYEEVWSPGRQVVDSEGRFIAGPMRAKLTSTYRTINPGFAVLSGETRFWIIPWKLILITLAVTVALVVGVRYYRNRNSK